MRESSTLTVNPLFKHAAQTKAHIADNTLSDNNPRTNPLRPVVTVSKEDHNAFQGFALNSPADRRVGWLPGRLYPLIPGRLFFTAHENDHQTLREIQQNPQTFFFSTDLQDRYYPFCADFGPVNLGALVQFCDYMQGKFEDSRLKGRPLVYYCSNDYESVSNTAFLLSAFLLLHGDYTPEAAFQPFRDILDLPIVPFRDPTYHKSTFPITILDCLYGLKKARDLGWFDLSEFDLDEYEELSAPDTGGDTSILCPKFVAFRGPEENIAAAAESGANTPDLYIKKLAELGVSKVVRLNDPETYSKEVFERAGFKHVELHFEDCTTPSDELVVRFLEECEGEEVVGVHCLAGLGRTGTMIGVWMMSKHGFTAREAIAWMRIVRPGCVIGPQQHFLEWMEARIREGNFPGTSRASNLAPGASPKLPAFNAVVSQQLASQVRQAIANRGPAV